MSELLNLDQSYTVVTLPEDVTMNGLEQVTVRVGVDPNLQPGQLAVGLEPPEAFHAVYGKGEFLSVDSANELSGGTVRLCMPPESQLPRLHIAGEDLDLSVRGTQLHPLLLGGLTLKTEGRGTIVAEHVRVAEEGRLENYSDGTRVRIGEGVTANPLLASSDAVYGPLPSIAEDAAA
ncbi:MAG TPA: hypothetical protein VLI54_03340 [Bacillota bacterium]|nr:hypothetical protein [Bacillota bacterium]